MSTLPTNRLFGRRWEILIVTNPQGGSQTVLRIASDGFKTEGLRALFEVSQVGYPAWWYGDVTFYNLNSETAQVIIKEGYEVIVSAGYDKGAYGQLFKGKVFQPLWERENVTDFKVTLRCMVGRDLTSQNFVNFTNKRLATQREIVANMAKAAYNPIPLGVVTDNLPKAKLPRAYVAFGDPRDTLNNVARGNNSQWFISDRGLELGNMTEVPSDVALVYTPSTGLVGTPQQTEEGVNFRVLLDPRLKVKYPPMQVKIDQTQTRQIKRAVGDNVFTVLDRDGMYLVGGLKHYGDTRGNDWYSEVVGITSSQGKVAAMMIAAGKQDPNQ